MGIQPLQDWTLIEPSEAKGKTTGGCSSQTRPRRNRLKEKSWLWGKGAGKHRKRSRVVNPKEREKGLQVHGPQTGRSGPSTRNSGTTDVELDGKELVLVRESDILGIVR